MLPELIIGSEPHSPSRVPAAAFPESRPPAALPELR